MSHVIEVAFDPTSYSFTFTGLVPTPVGWGLYVPYTRNLSEPTEIIVKRKSAAVAWNFEAIIFRGPPLLSDSWATVIRDVTSLPKHFRIEPLKLEVQSFCTDQIIIKDTNLSTQIDLVIGLQITINDPVNGAWTSRDPQIINEKKSD